MEEIKFYSEKGNWGEFSNFALYPIRIDGEIWPTTEHYFQAQKFENNSYKDKIRKSRSPMKAAELGRSRKMKIKKNWDRIKDNIMYDAVFAKFTQYSELTDLLIKTNHAKIIEHTENDTYWGDGGDGKGKNKLGKILMKVRSKLRSV
ncbi:NADAR family protein [uncultured Aquimarina sp.]|uniref:NADAR family protein n=1 Tax=uncultured Aquimarina sp. TaxID=575652 RepID=UPI002628E502|nr:NADAR family protein [uncultured Aquimarina sp.]